MKEVLLEMQHEPQIPVQDDALCHTKYSNHMLHKQVCCLGRSDALMHRYQYNLLGGPVYYCDDSIEPMQHRQAKYKVHSIVTEPISRWF